MELAALTRHPPPWKAAAQQLLPKSEPTWHHPSETHFFWSLKQESHHKPEAESASHSASGSSIASAWSLRSHATEPALPARQRHRGWW